MTFRHFLDASHTLLVESFLTVAPNRVDLLTAIEKVDESWRQAPTAQAPSAPAVSPEQQMAAMLASVKGAPKLGV